MTLILNALLFFAGIFLVILAMGTLVLPIVYFLPRTAWWVARGWLRWAALVRCAVAIGLWIGFFMGGAAAAIHFLPRASGVVMSASGWKFGQSVGLLFSLIRLVARTGRSDLRRDFIRGVAPYFTAAGGVQLGEGSP